MSLSACHCWWFMTLLLHTGRTTLFCFAKHTNTKWIYTKWLISLILNTTMLHEHVQRTSHILHRHIIANRYKAISSCDVRKSRSLIGLTQCLTANRACKKIKKRSRVKSWALEALHHPPPRSAISIHPSTCPVVHPHNFKESPLPGNPVAGVGPKVRTHLCWEGEGAVLSAGLWRWTQALIELFFQGRHGNRPVILRSAGLKVGLGQEKSVKNNGKILNLLYHNHECTVQQ